MTAAATTSVWSVLRHGTFRAIWTAGLISMIGSWMQSLGAAWLMTELDPSPVMVGLVQAAQMIPGICLAPLAGALADMFDRRRYLMAVMAWQTAVTLLLALLTFTGLITPWLLIGCILGVGIGAACQMPAMSANLQEIVPREEIIGAVTLNSIAMNISRAVGPAFAGLLVGVTGEAPAFLINSGCYAAYMEAVRRNVRATKAGGQLKNLRETISGGVRYARKARRFQAVLIRGFSYFLFASAVMALLPILARVELQVGPERFGTFLGFIGLGAIITGFGIVPRVSGRFSRDQIVMVAGLIVAASIIGIGWVRHPILLDAILVVFGGAWMISMVSFQISAQMVLPAWVRGRGLSLSMMSFSGGMATGSIMWGAIAEHISLAATFTVAGAGLAAASVLTRGYLISGSDPEEV